MQSVSVQYVTVVGAGDMGHGIAQLCAQAGYTVTLTDISEKQLETALFKIEESLNFLVGKEKITAGDKTKILNGRLFTTTDLAEAVKPAHLVIEAVPEIMSLKKQIFSDVSSVVSKEAILASNTSTMRISDIASAVSNPERFAGMHFFNPVMKMKLVELVYGEKTDEATVKKLTEITKKMKRIPVPVLKDTPGFIVNRINAPNQALLSALLDEDKEKPDALDTVMKKMGLPMGPYETIDFVGIDVVYHTMSYYASALSKEYAPGKVITEKFESQELGKKTGKGIYQWNNNKPVIDQSTQSTDITPKELLAVQINEAVKVYKEGLTQSVKDIDLAIMKGMGAFAGPFAICQGMPHEELSETLNTLSKRFGLDIFKPEPEITDGSFKALP